LTEKSTFSTLRLFLDAEKQNGMQLIILNDNKELLNTEIGLGLNKHKDIILKEDTGIELGGFGHKSFLMIHPTEEIEIIKDGSITILGAELEELEDTSIDFGLLILIGINSFDNLAYQELKNLNFVSNGIEGFSIRTIPRRFWCRISKKLMEKNFSFSFLAKAVMHLYRLKFKEIIERIEIFIVNSDPEVIDNFLDIISNLTNMFKKLWKDKIEEWKKRIDCDYDWGCEICPYQEDCQDIKEVLDARNQLEK
jgi:CO dehydrogenase/acetyl-CoA synthase beta subunit